MRAQHGRGLPDDHLHQMLTNTLPDRVANDVVNQPDINCAQQIVDYVLLDVKLLQKTTHTRLEHTTSTVENEQGRT